jgi:predicted nucleotidyltransferase
VNAGILATESVGRHQYYWADPDCMVYSELKGLVRKTFGAADMLRTALLPIDDFIELAMVFGSVAAGTDTAKSDIDLLVIGSASFRQLATALGKTEQGFGRSVNPVLFSRKEFRSKYRGDNHFVRTITESEKLFIKGSSDELAKLAGESVVKERSHN